jgi:hypothetical protein
MQVKKKNNRTFEKSLRQTILISGFFSFVVFVVLGLYKSVHTVIERIFVLGIGLMLLCPLIPIAICLIFNFILASNKNQINNLNDIKPYKTNIANTKKSNTEPNNTKIKVVTTEGYTEFNNLLKVSIQNKLLDRESILKLKCELQYRLGTHIEVYKSFSFENDIHELYVLSKSSVLTKDDYLYLTQFISNNLNLPKEA